MTTQTTSQMTTQFSAAERQALRDLRQHYREDRDLFNAAERAHLRFLRWLYRSGRLEP